MVSAATVIGTPRSRVLPLELVAVRTYVALPETVGVPVRYALESPGVWRRDSPVGRLDAVIDTTPALNGKYVLAWKTTELGSSATPAYSVGTTMLSNRTVSPKVRLNGWVTVMFGEVCRVATTLVVTLETPRVRKYWAAATVGVPVSVSVELESRGLNGDTTVLPSKSTNRIPSGTKLQAYTRFPGKVLG